MLLRTHYVIAAFFIILLISSVEHKFIFVVVTMFGTQLPDIDSRYSRIGHRNIARVLQWFTRHRGLIHSYTFLVVLTVILVMMWPISAFGFFLGYGLHLLSDSFTPDGIRPFYPSKMKSRGNIKTGGKMEIGLFVGLLLVDIILILQKVFAGF